MKAVLSLVVALAASLALSCEATPAAAAPKVAMPTGISACADCERFVVIMKALAKHRYTGRVAEIVRLADLQLCEDLDGSFEVACKKMVGKHGFKSIPGLAKRTPSEFCNHLKKCGSGPEKPAAVAGVGLASKQVAGDTLLAARDEDTDDDSDDDSDDNSDDNSDDDSDDDDDDDEDEKKAALLRHALEKYGDAAQVALDALPTKVIRRVRRVRRVTRRTHRRRRRRRRRRRSSKSKKTSRRRRRRRRRRRKSKVRLPKDHGYELAKSAYKIHKSTEKHWNQLAALHEMAMLTGSQSPISTSGMDMNADLFRPDSHTMDTFSDGSSVNQDLGLGHHGDDDDSEEMTNGAYDDPWLISIHPGLAAERAITAGDGNSGKRDLGSWLKDLQKRIILGNPGAGIHSYGMGMNPGGVLGTR